MDLLLKPEPKVIWIPRQRFKSLGKILLDPSASFDERTHAKIIVPKFMPNTTYLDTALNQLIFGDTAYSIPGTLYTALSTTTPSQTKGTAPLWNFTEPSSGGYARLGLTNNTTNWHALGAQPGTGQTQSNAVAVTFAQASGQWSTGSNMTYWGIWDALTLGNLLCFGAITNPQPVNTGDTPSFAIDVLQMTIN